MRKILLTVILLTSTSAFAEMTTTVYRAHAPTIESAQAIVNAINSGRLRVCDNAKVYDVKFPANPTTTRVNRRGQIEIVPSKTSFKVRCHE